MVRFRFTLAASAAVLVAAAACSAGDVDGSADADTLTRRQRDSIVSTLPIPGAGAVGRALDASDEAAERARRLESGPRR